MKRTVVTLVMTVLLAATLAGCIGGGGFGSGAPRAIVKVQQVGEETYLFDGSDSSGKGLNFAWDFGDGTSATDSTVEHTYEYGDATYSVRLVIEDSEGTKDVWEDEIVVGSGENRPPVALFRPSARNYEVDSPVRVDASESFDPDGAPLVYKWDFNFLMDFDEYEDFRAAKKEATENASEGDGDGIDVGDDESNEPGLQQSTPGLRDTLEKLDPTGILGKKHAGHGGENNNIERSIFSHEAETEQPVYTMEEGFPDATTFFIKLQVTDVAGGFEQIVSEEIWAVEVHETGRLPATTASDGTSDFFEFGVASQAQETHDAYVPNDGVYTYKHEWTFELDWPVAPAVQDGTTYYPGGYINLTWQAESDELADSILDMNVTSPSGRSMSPQSNDGGSAQITLDGRNDYVEGNWDKPWTVQITARSGLNIDWQVEYWVKMVTNPFLDFEDEE